MRFRLRDYALPIAVLKNHRLMNAAPFWPPDRLEEWVRHRRTAIVQHAYDTVPYYRRLFDQAGIRPNETARPEVWAQIPTIAKTTICDEGESMISTSGATRGAVWAETSGSTGLKLRILLDREVNAAAFALFIRAWGSGGHYHFWQRHAAMKGLSYDAGWRYNRAIRCLELSSARINPDSARFFRDLILQYRPRFMRGYPSAMYLFCRLLREQKLELHIPMVISGSETLYPFQRQEIEDFLGARMYNHYTHWERAASVLECSAGRLHAQQDYGFHEILDSEGRAVGPGEPGVITVTTLHNRAMPLIRYRTGDIAVWSAEPCSCGQNFPSVGRIEGRQTDYLVTPGGDVVSGTFAVEAFRTMPNLLSAQIVQSEIGRIEVRIVKGAGYREPESTRMILDALHQRLGADMKIEIRFCGIEDLERSPVGKIRQCFNRVPADQLARLGVAVTWGLNAPQPGPPGVSRAG
jgi:phenylacetate-coenzyme A ligase PaaK-like adenylate-forming protein